MGSWNPTCAISNLPIQNGEDVMAIILVKNNYNDFCYSNSYYSPVMLPFYAKYYDYGRIEKECGAGLKHVMNALREQIIELPLGENKYHDIEIKRDTFDLNTLMNGSMENRLFIKKINNKDVPLYLVYVKVSVVDELFKTFKFKKHWNDKRSLTYNQICKVVIDEIKEALKNIDQTKNHLFKYYIQNEIESTYLKSFLNICNGFDHTLIDPRHFITRLNEQEYFDCIPDMIKMDCLNQIISITRRAWLRPVGDGSQDVEYDNHLKFLTSCVKVSKIEKKQNSNF